MWVIPLFIVLGFGCIVMILALTEQEAAEEEQARNSKK